MGDMMQMMYTLVRFDAIITVEGGGEATTARGTFRESVAGSPVNRLGEIEARRSLHNAGQRRATTTSVFPPQNRPAAPYISRVATLVLRFGSAPKSCSCHAGCDDPGPGIVKRQRT